MKTVDLYCMTLCGYVLCDAGWFCGHPCQTNEPAELARGIGGGVDWSSLVHWACDFPAGGPAMAAVQL